MNDELEQNPETYKPLTDWEKEPTVSDLKKDLLEARNDHDNQTALISGYLDNLNVEGAAKPKTKKGNSQVQPKLIRKQAEWRYASLSDPFLSSPDLFDVNPVSAEDKESAYQNQLLLNNQFNTVLNKVQLIDEYVRTAVDEGTAILRVGWKYEEEEYEEEVPKFRFVVNPEFGPQIIELDQLYEQDPELYDAEVPEELKQAHQLSMENGNPVKPIPDGTETDTKTRVIANHPTVELCDYRNVIVDPTCKGDLDQASFVIFSFESSKSELEKTGLYENLDEIQVKDSSPLAEPDHESDEASSTFTFNDDARKKFVVYEYWGYRDLDGSGVVKPFVAAWVGDTMIRMDENPFPDQKFPFVFVPYLPKRRSLYGEPDGALLEDNQRIIGAVTRGMIDIMGKSANGQTGMRKDMLDGVNRIRYARGEDYEFNQGVDPRQGVHMHTYPEIPQSAHLMLQMQNAEAESLTGVKAFNNGISGQALGDTATGVRGALDASSKRELGILNRLSSGLIKVARKIIAMNAAFLDEEAVVRVTNEEFIPIRKDDLGGNFDLRLSISTAEEDNAKAQQLSFLLQTMGNNLDIGMTKLIFKDIARLNRMPELAKRIEEYEPQPDPLQQKKAELELQLMQVEAINMEAQAQERLAAAKERIAKANKLDSETDLNTLDFVEQESGVKQERDLQKSQAQAQANMQLEVVKNKLNKIGSDE